MIKHIQEAFTLYNGVQIPGFGLGVYKMEEGEQTITAVKAALEKGYRLIDTAAFYQNEKEVGIAIRESGIPRDEIFVTTKVWNSDQGYEETLAAFHQSMSNLDIDYIDLYLIHWPIRGKYKETWKAIEEMYDQGKIRAIGVSNFHQHHIEDLMQEARIKPMVNQVELHPLLTQVELREYCKQEGILVQAWSPLARGRLLTHPTLETLARKYGKSPAQIVLRWHIQNDVIAIPKSVSPVRIRDNADLFEFELSIKDMLTIDQLNCNERTGRNPDDI
ncbi:MAG: aldo/keto reductase [Bacillus sp. (in: firmicutes)]